EWLPAVSSPAPEVCVRSCSILSNANVVASAACRLPSAVRLALIVELVSPALTATKITTATITSISAAPCWRPRGVMPFAPYRGYIRRGRQQQRTRDSRRDHRLENREAFLAS